jgi:hypothetical protein
MRSILAGATAGAVEICNASSHPLLDAFADWLSQQSHTLPSVRCPPIAAALPTTDHCTVAKTRSQLNRRLTDGKKLPWPPFGKQWYAGCTTLIIGNSIKAGISMWAAFAGRSSWLTSRLHRIRCL